MNVIGTLDIVFLNLENPSQGPEFSFNKGVNWKIVSKYWFTLLS